MPIKVKETYRTANRLDQKKKPPQQIIIKILIMQDKQRILKSESEVKDQVTSKSRPIRVSTDFSTDSKIHKVLQRCPADYKKSQMQAQTTIPSRH